MNTIKEDEKLSEKLDVFSIILYLTGFCGLMLGVTNQEVYGWLSYFTLMPFILGAIFISGFVYRQLNIPQPLLNIRILKNKRMALATSLIIITYIAMMSGTMMLPIYIQSVMGLSAAVSGAVLLPGASTIAFLSPVTGILFDKYGFKVISFLGMSLLILGNGAFAFFKVNTSIFLITLMYAVRMCGISFLLMPLQAYGMSRLNKNELSHGTAIINSFRQIFGALGSTILIAIMSASSRDIGVTDIVGMNFSFGIETLLIIIALIGAIYAIRVDS